MGLEIYSFTTSVAATEQDLITDIDTFLVSTIGGWTRFETISDTGTNRDYTWSTPGENPTDYPRAHWIRLRAQSNQVHFYGYGDYESSTVNWQEAYDASKSYVPTGGSVFRYWLVGNKDFLQVHVKNGDSGAYHIGYAGFLRSYYVPGNDPYPLLVKGQPLTAYGWDHGTTSVMHNATTSGVAGFVGYLWNTQLGSDTHNRTNEVCLLPVPMYTTEVANEEVRGEPYGVYQVNGLLVGHASPLTSASGTFICFKIAGTDSRTYAYGPIASGTTDISLW